MTISEFQHQSVIRCEAENGFNHKVESWSLSDWMTALAGEVGEAANIVKKLNRIRDGVGLTRTDPHTEKDLRIALAYEIADIMGYLPLLAEAAGISLEAATVLKFNMVSADIGYPVQLPKPL